MTGPLSRSRSVERINEDDGTRNNAHRGHWGRSEGTARLRLRMDKPLRMSARTLPSIAIVSGVVILARPDAPTLFAGADPDVNLANASQPDQDLTTTLSDQSEIALTAYPSHLAL